jgi:hypothetical protein
VSLVDYGLLYKIAIKRIFALFLYKFDCGGLPDSEKLGVQSDPSRHTQMSTNIWMMDGNTKLL